MDIINKITIKDLIHKNGTRHTQPPKSLHTFSSAWSKTTVNTGGVGGEGQTFTLEKQGHFSCVLGTIYANFQQFPKKLSFRRNS